MASIARRFDFQLDGKGYMLVRGEYKGRAWNRTGASDSPSRRSSTDAKYGELPDELDHPEVWDDWSGGYGLAYRRNGENMYHWAENFDARNPRQLVHCQNTLKLSTANYASYVLNTKQFAKMPPNPNASWASGYPPIQYNAANRIIVWGNTGPVLLEPNSVGSLGEINAYEVTTGLVGRPATHASGMIWPYTDASGNPYLARIVNIGNFLVASIPLPYLTTAQTSDRTWIAIGGSGNIRPVVRTITGDQTVTANLTASLIVGSELYGINDMAAIEDEIYISTPNAIYAGDQSGTFVNLTPWMEHAANRDNFRDLMPYNSGLLAQAVQGLWYYEQNGFTARWREIPVPNPRSYVRGYVRALSQHAGWVYAGLWTGSGSHVIASNDIDSPKPTWHTMHAFPNQAISRMFFDGITNFSGTAAIPSRQYVAMSSDLVASCDMYNWMIPANNGNPLLSQPNFSPNYIGSARIDLGNVDWNSPSTPKSFRSVEVWADTLLSGYRYADVYYDVDQSGSFTLLGRANTSPVSTIFFPAGEGSFVSGQSIELSLRSFTASPALTPVYRSIVLRGALRPNSIDQITAVVRIADGVRDRQGGSMRNGATMLKELRDLAAQDTPTTLIDLTGAVSYVNVLPPVQESEYYQKGEDNPEVAATVKMSVMVFS